MSNSAKTYVGAYRFLVELEGMVVGGFSEVSGLQAETEVEEYQEGGLNTYVHRLPKRTKYPNIVLKRGATSAGDLWSWYHKAYMGQVQRKDGSIIMQDNAGNEVCRWNFFQAYPVKWNGPELNAKSSDVAVETFELVHNGWRSIFTRK